METEWFGRVQTGPAVPRVRNLRHGSCPTWWRAAFPNANAARRWQQLADIYLAQQLAAYPPGYLVRPTVDRVLEIIEKFEEDITDKARLHGQLKVVLDVGEAIEVSPERERGVSVDPLMMQIQQSLQAMIDQLAAESPLTRAEPEQLVGWFGNCRLPRTSHGSQTSVTGSTLISDFFGFTSHFFQRQLVGRQVGLNFFGLA